MSFFAELQVSQGMDRPSGFSRIPAFSTVTTSATGAAPTDLRDDIHREIPAIRNIDGQRSGIAPAAAGKARISLKSSPAVTP